MQSAAVAIDFAGELAGVDFLAKDIVQVSKGIKFNEKQKEHVMEYFRKDGLENFRGHKFKRTDTPDKGITVDTFYFPVHLAIIYKNRDILELFYEKMKDDEDYTREILNLQIESSLDKVKYLIQKSIKLYKHFSGFY